MITRDGLIPGLALLQLKSYRDERGFFMERFRQDWLKDLGVDALVQDNHSRSAPGVLRGLHYQSDPAQGKFVSVIRGKIWDVVVDLRKGSAHYGKSYGVELSEENGMVLWVPYGFAHGFCVMGDCDADVIYKVTGYYNPKAEGGVRWDDPDLRIEWPVANPKVSPRDQVLPKFRDVKPL
jgi:dTDP-4-dehydrorhamnose 3,5-epimerase